MMGDLVSEIRRLRAGGLSNTVEVRLREFDEVGRQSIGRVFSELCFCIMTANYNAEKAIAIQDAVGDGFMNLGKTRLEKKLRSLGYRYPKTRAGYMTESRKKITALAGALETLEGAELRNWVVENIKGLGMKEASHFLRNIGRRDYAIIDFHIIDVLADRGLIARPKTLTKNKYVEIEGLLRDIAGKTGLSLSELDLYLWYLETGRILK